MRLMDIPKVPRNDEGYHATKNYHLGNTLTMDYLGFYILQDFLHKDLWLPRQTLGNRVNAELPDLLSKCQVFFEIRTVVS